MISPDILDEVKENKAVCDNHEVKLEATGEESGLQPIKVEIKEDPLGGSPTPWENSREKTACEIPTSAVQFRSYDTEYAEVFNNSVSQQERDLIDKKTTGQSVQLDSEENKTTDGKLYTCSYCMKYFKLKKTLMDHLKFHTGNIMYQCNICQSAFTEHSSLIEHRKTHVESVLGCQICGKSYQYGLSLIKSHTNRFAHTCNACKNRFVKPCVPATHLDQAIFLLNRTIVPKYKRKSSLPVERRLACSTCDKKFSVLSDLTKHRRVHTGERPYVCALCQKGFKQSSALTSHFRTHTGERPYACPLCFKAFTQSSALNTHMKIHSVSSLDKTSSSFITNSDSPLIITGSSN